MLQALLGPVASLAKTWMNNRHEQSQAKHQAKMQVISNTATWEEKMAEASANSWKDEFWTVVLAVPLFCLGYSVVAVLLIVFVTALTFYLLSLIGISICFFWR